MVPRAASHEPALTVNLHVVPKLGKQVLSSFAKTANSNTVFGMVKTADLAACWVRRGRGLCFTTLMSLTDPKGHRYRANPDHALKQR